MPKGQIGRKHKSRFHRWQNLAPKPTRELSGHVERLLAPTLEGEGFCWVDNYFGGFEEPVGGRDIRFERRGFEYIDSIDISFDKYNSPSFQMSFSRRAMVPPYEFLRAGNLVKRPKQYYYRWGKRWFVPLSMWHESDSLSTVEAVCFKVSQILDFLGNGRRGPNISRSTF